MYQNEFSDDEFERTGKLDPARAIKKLEQDLQQMNECNDPVLKLEFGKDMNEWKK